ncbi:MAG: hypothetical protein HOY71_30950 [Nonomuraea sp.]|nr:hypothetical protein [Nonomuraea sp.]
MPILAKTLAATGVSALCLTLAPTTAHAASAISCKVASGQVQYRPGMQRFQLPDLVLHEDRIGNCADRSGLGVTTASLRADFTGVDLSCGVRDFSAVTGVVTVGWNTRGAQRTSTAQVKIDQVVGSTAKVSGTVSTGQFAGRRFTGSFDAAMFGNSGTCISSSGLGNSITTTFQGDFSVT